MISTDKVTAIFCSIDDFCNVFEPALKKKQLSDGKKTRKRKFRMSMSDLTNNKQMTEIIKIKQEK